MEREMRICLHMISLGGLRLAHALLDHHRRGFALMMDAGKRAIRRALVDVCRQLEAELARRQRNPEGPAYLLVPQVSTAMLAMPVASAFLAITKIVDGAADFHAVHSEDARDGLRAICLGITEGLCESWGLNRATVEQLVAQGLAPSAGAPQNGVAR